MAEKLKPIKVRLIEATIREIEAVGPEKLSLRKIAAACGTTHASIYKYFKNKQDLILSCCPYVLLRFTAYIKRSIKDADVPYVALCKAYMRYMLKHPQYHYLLHLSPKTQGDGVTQKHLEQERRYAGFWGIIDDYMQQCGVKKETYAELCALVSSILNGVIILINRNAVIYHGDVTDLVDILILDRLNLRPIKQ
ncbi:MAG: TetR/AcrR family transcriptional regulator [Christensenella sp.]